FQISQRRSHPVLRLELRGELHPARISLDRAGKGEVRPHSPAEGLRRICPRSRRHAGKHMDQGPDPYAYLRAVVIGGKSAVDLQQGSEVVLLLYLLDPAKFGLDAIRHAIPGVILDVNVVGRAETATGAATAARHGSRQAGAYDVSEAAFDRVRSAVLNGRVNRGAQFGVDGGPEAPSLVANYQRHRL